MIKAQDDLVEFIKNFSITTWNKLEFVHKRKNLRMGEVTITQDFVFHFHQLSQSGNFVIDIFESKLEKANGNDLEILIETSKGILKMPTQAKVIHKNGKYKTIYHSVGGVYQVDLLIAYARKEKGFPLYLLYNEFRGDLSALSSPFQLWGCSIGSAQEVKKISFSPSASTPSFSDYHPAPFVPLYRLFETIWPNFSGKKLEGLFSDLKIGDLRYYTRDEIMDDLDWSNLKPKGLGFIPPKSAEKISIDSHSDNQTFSPKFRILLSGAENKNTGSLMFLD